MNRAKTIAKLEEMTKIRQSLQGRLSQQNLSEPELKELLSRLERIYRLIQAVKK